MLDLDQEAQDKNAEIPKQGTVNVELEI